MPVSGEVRGWTFRFRQPASRCPADSLRQNQQQCHMARNRTGKTMGKMLDQDSHCLHVASRYAMFQEVPKRRVGKGTCRPQRERTINPEAQVGTKPST